MSTNNPNHIEQYRAGKQKAEQRARPKITPDKDRNQISLFGDRVQMGTIRERRQALHEGRFSP